MIWVAEYSGFQDSFHVQPLTEALKTNLRRVLVKDRGNDWCLVGWGDEAEVRRMAEAIRQGQVRLLQRKG